MANKYRGKTDYEKIFVDAFEKLCYSRSPWPVWCDSITAMACALANSIEDKNSEIYAKREKEYEQCIKRLGGSNELSSQMFAATVMALEENPDQDFLGSMFMKLDLGNNWLGQFFTPYNVCRLMAEVMTADDAEKRVSEKGWATVNDCACGAGATLIATANVLKERNIDYHNHVLFVAQDIDRIAAMMCYVQLSLFGCAGYVVVADSLANPLIGDSLQPIQQEGQEFWFTPMYADDVWNMRRLCRTLDSFLAAI